MAALTIATAPALGAATPCDILRDELRNLAAAHPEATDDTGRVDFLSKVLDPKIVKPAYNNINQGPPGSCDGVLTWLEKAGFDTSIVADLERGDSLCYESVSLYDERAYGGFIVLFVSEGSLHCTEGQVIALGTGRPELGPAYSGDCAPTDFSVIRLSGTSFPAVMTANVFGGALDYRLDLFAGDAKGDKVCSLTLHYQPQFRVSHWFGPKGQDDIDPVLRKAIEPIVIARAAGRETRTLTDNSLDHPRGDSPYDLALRAYPASPINALQYPNGKIYDIPLYVPFTQSPFTVIFGNFHDDDAMPLFIAGRRLLLAVGPATMRQYPAPGFGVFEWKHNDFEPVAGGIMEKYARNPVIE